ncbi:septation protein A [Pantoea sp. Aalb]|uniref:septation protein A n=1 Tax=Pantoea sp. Aalb TaxID=2576762 RepID=UPI00132BBB9F|nr:septation protein A [Pantoea sp. Aalb]MXP67387.1 septation protein A [Pantoea sp. Aalb]
MQQIFDFLSLILFFVFYKKYNIYVACIALMITTGISVIANFIFYRKIDNLNIFTFILVIFFSTLTLIFHNDEFIRWKVTVIYFVLALVLIYSQYVTKQPVIKTILGKNIKLSNMIWRRLNISWAVFFLLCGSLNIYVAFWLSQEFWVNFKVFGLTGITLLFTLFNSIYICRQITK